MHSANPEINSLHQAYCQATGMELALLPASERWWYEAVKAGMQIEDIQLVVKDRQKRVKNGRRHKESLLLRNFIGSDEAIQSVMEESAAIRALKRAMSMHAKAEHALREFRKTPVERDAKACRSVGEVLKTMTKL